MSAPPVIDALEFARSAQEASGSVSVSALQRLEDLLHDTSGMLHYELRGRRDERNRPLIGLNVTGGLHLQCQRCLGLLEYPVDFSNTLLVLPQGAEPKGDPEDPDEPDSIEASEELDVVALIEDEVLLSLPLAPRHPEGTCVSRFESQPQENAASPAFEKLAALKRPENKH